MARKLVKARQDVRERIVEKLEQETSQYPLVEYEKTYQSYPDEWVSKYEVLVPKQILDAMKNKGLVLVAINGYSAYDGKYINVYIFTPKEIENTWEKTVVAIDELPQI